MRYSALGLDQSMTQTAWAHLFQGDLKPEGGLFPMPSWGDDEGKYLNDFRYWLKDLCWERQVTHLFIEDTTFDRGRTIPGVGFVAHHLEDATQKIATVGLLANALQVADELKRAGQEIEALLVTNKQWANAFWGAEDAPKGLVKHQRQSWRKEQSIKQCHLRGWDCQHEGRDNHNLADAKGILNYGLICIDPRWSAASGPLFNRAQMARENEQRELR